MRERVVDEALDNLARQRMAPEFARLNAEIKRLRVENIIYREAAQLRDRALDERNEAEARLAKVVEEIQQIRAATDDETADGRTLSLILTRLLALAASQPEKCDCFPLSSTRGA